MEGLIIVPMKKNLTDFGPEQNLSPILEEGKRSHSLAQTVFEITTTFHAIRIIGINYHMWPIFKFVSKSNVAF